MAVVDVYDALQSRRPYKPPFPKEKGIAILRKGVESGWWDAEVVDALVEIVNEGEEPMGSPPAEGERSAARDA